MPAPAARSECPTRTVSRAPTRSPQIGLAPTGTSFAPSPEVIPTQKLRGALLRFRSVYPSSRSSPTSQESGDPGSRTHSGLRTTRSASTVSRADEASDSAPVWYAVRANTFVQPASASACAEYATGIRSAAPAVPAAPAVRHAGAWTSAPATRPPATFPAPASSVKQSSAGTLLRFTTIAESTAPVPGRRTRLACHVTEGVRYTAFTTTANCAAAVFPPAPASTAFSATPARA